MSLTLVWLKHLAIAAAPGVAAQAVGPSACLVSDWPKYSGQK